MDVLKCKAFVAAVDEGSLTGAGKVLGYTPSGISQLISAMESEFGFSLLIRKSNGVVATREGEYIYPLAVEYIDKESEIYKAATELSGMYKGNVMIAAYSSIAAQTLPQIIKDFTDLHPSINIQIEEATKNRIEKMVASGKADLSFSSRLSNPSYVWIPFAEDRMVAVLPRSHRDAGFQKYPIDRCKKENLIMPSEGDDADVRELFKRHGIVPNIRLTTLENYTAINMVEKGLGICIMNEGITRHWKTGTVILPVDPPSSIELGISLPSLEAAAPAVKEFVCFAAEKLGAESPECLACSRSN
ncbi:MAG: LysR family transcriptional regulator [Mogibacterium sp.]|nr:LysR family transcriptional regulator [Mogibacterium sp.]